MAELAAEATPEEERPPAEPLGAVGYAYPPVETPVSQAGSSQPPAAAAVEEPPFVPWFAVPSELEGHLPHTLRAHKVCLALSGDSSTTPGR